MCICRWYLSSSENSYNHDHHHIAHLHQHHHSHSSSQLIEFTHEPHSNVDARMNALLTLILSPSSPFKHSKSIAIVGHCMFFHYILNDYLDNCEVREIDVYREYHDMLRRHEKANFMQLEHRNNDGNTHYTASQPLKLNV